MKWVQVREGNYKYVEDEDERPAVRLKHKRMFPNFILAYSPSWRRYETAMVHPDSKNQGEATDKFVAEREHEMKTDPKAKRWEEGRKAEWVKAKPAWRKRMMQEGKI